MSWMSILQCGDQMVHASTTPDQRSAASQIFRRYTEQQINMVRLH